MSQQESSYQVRQERIALLGEHVRNHAAALALGSIAIAGGAGFLSVDVRPAHSESNITALQHVGSALFLPAVLESHETHTRHHGSHHELRRTRVLGQMPRVISVIQNDKSGYPIGNLTGQDAIKVAHLTKNQSTDVLGRRWIYGLMIHVRHQSDNECGWMLAEKAAPITQISAPNICLKQMHRLAKRSTILSEANGDAHEFGGGSITPVPLRKRCHKNSLYLNYSVKDHTLYDRLPVKTHHGIHWRLKSPDHLAIIGQIKLQAKIDDRTKEYSIWPAVDARCAIGKLPHNGPPNSDRAIAAR